MAVEGEMLSGNARVSDGAVDVRVSDRNVSLIEESHGQDGFHSQLAESGDGDGRSKSNSVEDGNGVTAIADGRAQDNIEDNVFELQATKLERMNLLLKRGIKFTPSDSYIHQYLGIWKRKEEFSDDWVILPQIDVHADEFPWDIFKHPINGNDDTWFFVSWVKLKVGGVARSFAGGAGHWDMIGTKKLTDPPLFTRKYRFASELGIEDPGYEWTLKEYQLDLHDHEAFCRVHKRPISHTRKRKPRANPKNKSTEVSKKLRNMDGGSSDNQGPDSVFGSEGEGDLTATTES